MDPYIINGGISKLCSTFRNIIILGDAGKIVYIILVLNPCMFCEDSRYQDGDTILPNDVSYKLVYLVLFEWK